MRSVIIIIVILLALSNFSSWIEIGVSTFNDEGKFPFKQVFEGAFGIESEEEIYGEKETDQAIIIFHEKAKDAFKAAEKKYMEVEIDDVKRPDPDVAKCVCKGTGTIVHGDGHKTPCPYHGRQMMELQDQLKAAQDKLTAKMFDDQPKDEVKKKLLTESTQAIECECQCGPDCPCEEGKCECSKSNECLIKMVKPATEGPKKPDEVVAIEKSVEVDVPEKPKYGNFGNKRGDVKYQLILCTANWCVPCKKMKDEEFPKLKELGIIISDQAEADIFVVDIDNNKEWYNKIRDNIDTIPMIVEVKNNTILRRETKAKTAEDILKLYDLERN